LPISLAKSGSSGATWRRPKPAGALTRRCPEGRTLPCETRDSRSFSSRRMRWASSRKALPSEVRDMLRVERTSSLMPNRASRALMRRPIMAGATPSWRAAAERLPSVATATKLSSCLKRLIQRSRPAMADSARQQQGGQFGPDGRQLFGVGPALMADFDARPPETLDLVGQCTITRNAGQFDLEGVAF